MSRNVVTIVIIAILIIGVFVLFQLFRATGEEERKVQTLVITSEEKFEPKELTLGNDEAIEIRNDSDEKQTVKKGDETVAELDSGQTSEEINLGEDSENTLVIADDEGAKVVVGTPAEIVEEVPVDEEEKVDNGGEPLPDTGPDNLFVFPLVMVLGLLIRIFHKVELK